MIWRNEEEISIQMYLIIAGACALTCVITIFECRYLWSKPEPRFSTVIIESMGMSDEER